MWLISNIVRIGISIIWSAQIADVICFSKEGKEGNYKRQELLLSSFFYTAILCCL